MQGGREMVCKSRIEFSGECTGMVLRQVPLVWGLMVFRVDKEPFPWTWSRPGQCSRHIPPCTCSISSASSAALRAQWLISAGCLASFKAIFNTV